ncbi:MAG: DUF4349 domain-containing protein [Dermatophilaceae bacterium]
MARGTPGTRAAAGWRRASVMVLASMGLLAGCSAGDSAGSAASATHAAASAAVPSPARGAATYEDKAAGADPASAGVDVTDQKLVRTATLSLQVNDIGQATARVRAANLAAGGIVLSENIGSYPSGEGDTTTGTAKVSVNPHTYAVLVVSVPVDKLDATLDELQKIGTVLDRRSETQNVTEDYVDVQARVASMKKSVARVQDLIGRTSDIDQLVRLEQELSTRQADLESMEARLASLDRQTARSPITVNLTTDPALVTTSTTPADGFTGGLAKGWHAFVVSVVAALTVLGAILPFALLGAVVGVPVLVLWRRARRPRPAVRVYATALEQAPPKEKVGASG